jgi:hypothetical protein
MFQVTWGLPATFLFPFAFGIEAPHFLSFYNLDLESSFNRLVSLIKLLLGQQQERVRERKRDIKAAPLSFFIFS